MEFHHRQPVSLITVNKEISQSEVRADLSTVLRCNNVKVEVIVSQVSVTHRECSICFSHLVPDLMSIVEVS